MMSNTIYIILKFVFLPLYLFLFFIVAMLGIVIYSCMFFYLGPFAPVIGVFYGTSWAISCFTGKGFKMKKMRK